MYARSDMREKVPKWGEPVNYLKGKGQVWRQYCGNCLVKPNMTVKLQGEDEEAVEKRD